MFVQEAARHVERREVAAKPGDILVRREVMSEAEDEDQGDWRDAENQHTEDTDFPSGKGRTFQRFDPAAQ